MRLFLAINFTEEVKNQLCSAISLLKENALQGNFTRRENLHLTLVFIGETTKVNEVKRAMNLIHMDPFRLKVGGLGRFQRDGGDLYWIGVEKNSILSVIYSQAYAELTKAGFRLENRDYKPHLTLGREVVLNNDFDLNTFEKAVPEMSMEVEKISLMKSERINGVLTYTEISKR